MAAKRKKTNNTKQNTSNQQIKSVVWFALSVFFLCVVFIKGQNVWTSIHNFIFGIFGVTTYFFPFLMMFIAVMCTLNRYTRTVNVKVIETTSLVLLIAAMLDVIMTKTSLTENFGEHLTAAYKVGVTLKNGGFVGAFIGHPLFLAFGKTGAIITFALLVFVVVMLLTSASLAELFRSLARPVQSVSEQAEKAHQERLVKRQEGKAVQESNEDSPRKKKKFDIDIPVDEHPAKKDEKDVPLGEKQRKVVAAYHGEEMPEPEEEPVEDVIEGENDREVMEKALKTAQKEAEEKITSIDVEREEMKITEQISGGMTLHDEEGYHYPPVSLLNAPKFEDSRQAAADLDKTAENLVQTLRSFGVETKIVDISRGPTVTRYELQPCAGVKISKITNLADDIALNLATAGVRIEAPIPNKAAVGIEVPNKASATVGVREIIESPQFAGAKSKLTVAMGRDIAGNVIVGDVGKMPHGLIAGATGSGKSVCINSIIISLLYKASPDEVKLLMIDPKVVELGIYNGIPHLLVPVVTDPRKAAGALGWAVSEMEKRYQMFSDRGVRDIAGYNKFVETLTDEPEVKKMPHIVIIIDELADLMMTAPGEVEDSINRIAAKARAAGMHLLIATQRPSVDVVTGVIKANIPTRIAFAVSSQIDSRTILDTGGAEKLLGRGDMLFSPIGATKPNRLQGCFVSDEEVEAVVDFVKNGGSADYDDNIMVEIERQAAVEKQKKSGLAEDGPGDDPVLDEAIRVVVENGQASTSLLQRRLKLGYARAARIVDEMEERGIVGPYEGSKPRKVLITMDQLMEKQASEE